MRAHGQQCVQHEVNFLRTENVRARELGGAKQAKTERHEVGAHQDDISTAAPMILDMPLHVIGDYFAHWLEFVRQNVEV